jgi:FtsP/CotA-like multicopper oxidase with cupredoxin domain
MPNLRNRFPARRRFLKQSAALTATASLAAPMLVVAQAAPGSDATADAAADTAATSQSPATATGAVPASAANSPARTPR